MRKIIILISGLFLMVGQPAVAVEYADKLLGVWEGQQAGFTGRRLHDG
jgi:hypothetical protein